VLDVLNDGSYLSRLAAPAGAGPTHPVRVIEFALGGPYRSHPHSPAETVRLVCSVLEPEQAPGEDLAWAHSRRWRFDSVLDQLGARQGQAGPVLRSKSPAMVEQEVWAMLLAHHAIRRLVVAGDEESAADRAAFHRAFRPIERRSAK
jgi:hypothetical protein